MGDYTSFGQKDHGASGPFGVTIRFLHPDPDSMKKWFYCGTPCYKGFADCRVSTSILNHKVMVKNNFVENVLSLPIGVVFNQTMVETKLMKCSYDYDGGTDKRYNMGCGCGSNIQNCDSDQSAYKSIDPQTHQPMTSDSAEIKRCHCKGNDDQGCYWKGPAFFPTDGVNELSKMMEQRLQKQKKGYQDLDWTELIIDGKVLGTMLKQDASSAISAIVYVSNGKPDEAQKNYGYAQQLVSIFKGMYNFPDAPIVELDLQQNVLEGPGPFKRAHSGFAELIEV